MDLSAKTQPSSLPHLWSRTPEMNKIRRTLIIHAIRVAIIVWIVILLISLIYLGSGSDPYSRTDSLDVYVIDMDNDIAGNFFLNAFRNTPSGNLTLNWIFKQSSEFPSGFTDMIKDGKAWAFVYMNPNVTVRINQVIQSILYGYTINGTTYIPTSAVGIIYDEGRNPGSVNEFVLPPIRTAITTASFGYAAYIQNRINSYSNGTLSNVIRATLFSQIMWFPIAFTEKNIHPAYPYARLLATSLGYLFLWLIMTALVTVNIRITTPLADKIKIIDILIIRIISSIFNSLIISLIFSLCVLWFGNFTDAGPFIRFWMFNWLACLAFVSIIALFNVNLGVMAHVVIILFLILNFSSAGLNLTIELQNRFYRIGYGLPLFHCLSGGRHLLFGSYTRLGVDVGVLVAYYVFCILLTTITGVIHMHRQQNAAGKKKYKEILKQNQMAAIGIKSTNKI